MFVVFRVCLGHDQSSSSDAAPQFKYSRLNCSLANLTSAMQHCMYVHAQNGFK